jgi:ubiquinone biosynthesis protein Coq4
MARNRRAMASKAQGINWSELLLAYKTFKDDTAAGILHILAAGRHSSWEKLVMKRLNRQAANLEGKMVSINVSELEKLPQDTLGGAYARHLISNGFDPEAFTTPESSGNWLGQRLSIVHDVHHVMTGFDGTPVGEFGLAAFTFVQWGDMLNAFVLSWLPLFMLSDIKKAPKIFVSTIKGAIMGLRAKPIVTYAFEDNWEKPLVVVRQELGIWQ